MSREWKLKIDLGALFCFMACVWLLVSGEYLPASIFGVAFMLSSLQP